MAEDAWLVLNHKIDIFEFIEGLLDGDLYMWLALGVIIAVVIFLAFHGSISGGSFVKSSGERRRARERRSSVAWRYDRDDD